MFRSLKFTSSQFNTQRRTLGHHKNCRPGPKPLLKCLQPLHSPIFYSVASYTCSLSASFSQNYLFCPITNQLNFEWPLHRAKESCKQDTDKEKQKTTDSNQSLLYLRKQALTLYQVPHTQHPPDTKGTSLRIVKCQYKQDYKSL